MKECSVKQKMELRGEMHKGEDGLSSIQLIQILNKRKMTKYHFFYRTIPRPCRAQAKNSDNESNNNREYHNLNSFQITSQPKELNYELNQFNNKIKV